MDLVDLDMTLNHWAPNGLVLTFNEAQRPRIYLPGFLTGINTTIKKVQKQQMRLKFSSPMANLHLVHYRIWQG